MIPRRALLAAMAATPALAQQPWPTRPIRCLVGAGPGGTTDIVARLIAVPLTAALGQPVVVENRVGGGGTVTSDILVRSRPDGSTMMLLNNGYAAAAATFRRLPYDPVEDVTVVSTVANMGLVLLVSRNSPIASLRDLLDRAKAQPGSLNYASVGVGTTQHFVAETLQAMTGIVLTHVPYRSTADAMIALRNGDVQLVVETLAAVLAQIADGEARPLALSTAQRFAGLPQIPTVAEAGGPRDFDLPTWYALAFPARMPPAIVTRLHEALATSLRDASLMRQFADLGLTPALSSPEDARTQLMREIARAREIVARAGIPQQ